MKDLYFIRFGGLSSVTQKGYGKDGYHSPPVKRGLYAFPYNCIEHFLITNTRPHNKSKRMEFIADCRFTYVKDSNGNRIKYGTVSHDNYFNEIDKNVVNLKYGKMPIEHLNYRYHNKYLIKLDKPKKFKYSGLIWNHLHHCNVKVKRCDIIKENGSWILMDAFTYSKYLNFAIKMCKVPERTEGYTLPEDYLEVFIEKV